MPPPRLKQAGGQQCLYLPLPFHFQCSGGRRGGIRAMPFPPPKANQGAIISFGPPKQPMGPHGRMGLWPLFDCHETQESHASY